MWDGPAVSPNEWDVVRCPSVFQARTPKIIKVMSGLYVTPESARNPCVGAAACAGKSSKP